MRWIMSLPIIGQAFEGKPFPRIVDAAEAKSADEMSTGEKEKQVGLEAFLEKFGDKIDVVEGNPLTAKYVFFGDAHNVPELSQQREEITHYVLSHLPNETHVEFLEEGSN